MRVAVLSDIHGNVDALNAVLSQARDREVTAYWILGDLVAYGPRPGEVVELVRRLPGVECVRGNTDRYVLTGDVHGMIPSVRDADLLKEIHASLAWTRGALAQAGGIRWLEKRPIQLRVTLPDGTRVLLAHASPGRDDGPGARPDSSNEELAALGFTGEVADLVLAGHTHLAVDRRVNSTHVVNPGPVSLPPSRDGLARWAVLSSTDEGYSVEAHQTPYDFRGVVADLHRIGHPAAQWIAEKMGADVATA
jgi:predicted phosphodiesterase